MDMTRLTATPLQQPNDKTPDTHEINIANIPTLKLKALFKDIEIELKNREVTDKKNADQASLPKYINPDNPDQTWSGRGQQPKWLKEALVNGKTLEEFLTQPPEEQPETARPGA